MVGESSDSLSLDDAPPLAGLRFRRFRGASDFAHILAVLKASKLEDGDESSYSLDGIARRFRDHLTFDASRDMIFAEVDNRVVGYGRCWWTEQLDDEHLYSVVVNLVPRWRGYGIGRALVRFLEERLRKVSQGHGTAAVKSFYAEISERASHWNGLLRSEGYRVVRWWYEMVRPLDGSLPHHPLPKGFELRQVEEADILPIWKAVEIAFRDHWGATNWPEEDLARWRESPTFMPDLWQVAWKDDAVAATVLNHLNEAENQEQGRKRGYTEIISVGPAWRGRGLAKALIARSLKMWQRMGMNEAACVVDTDSPTGALKLYEGLGYRAVTTIYSYKKPM
jgi:mycothiol synthase